MLFDFEKVTTTERWVDVFFHTDFSEHAEFLSTLSRGPIDRDTAERLCKMFSAENDKAGMDWWGLKERGTDWTISTVDGLDGCDIGDCGPVGQFVPVNGRFANYVELLIPQQHNRPQGRMYLGYGTKPGY